MAVFTPTASSQFIAGFSFWGVIWSIIYKVDSIAKLVKLDGWISSDRILGWITRNKILSLLCTEFVNMATHDTESAGGVTVMIGGTLMNVLMIFVVLPIRNLFHRKHTI